MSCDEIFHGNSRKVFHNGGFDGISPLEGLGVINTAQISLLSFLSASTFMKCKRGNNRVKKRSQALDITSLCHAANVDLGNVLLSDREYFSLEDKPSPLKKWNAQQ